MKSLVKLVSVILICINVILFFYVQIMQAKLYSIAIILSCIFCPLGVIASACAFLGAEKKKSELLMPLIILLVVFIGVMAIAMIGLILSYFIADVTSNNGIILRLSYDTIVIPFGTSLAICFGGGAIALCILFLTYSLYKSTNKVNKEVKQQQRISTIERKYMFDSRPSSKATILTTDM